MLQVNFIMGWRLHTIQVNLHTRRKGGIWADFLMNKCYYQVGKKIFFCSFQIKSGINTCPSKIKSITSKQVKIGRKTKTKKVLWRTQAHHSRKFIFKAFRLKCQVNKAKNFTDFRRGYQQYPKNAKASLLATTTVRARETTSPLWGHFLRIWSVLLNIWHTRQSLYVLEHLSVKRMDVHISRTFMDKNWQ